MWLCVCWHLLSHLATALSSSECYMLFWLGHWSYVMSLLEVAFTIKDDQLAFGVYISKFSITVSLYYVSFKCVIV